MVIVERDAEVPYVDLLFQHGLTTISVRMTNNEAICMAERIRELFRDPPGPPEEDA